MVLRYAVLISLLSTGFCEVETSDPPSSDPPSSESPSSEPLGGDSPSSDASSSEPESELKEGGENEAGDPLKEVGIFPIIPVPILEGRLTNYDYWGSKLIAWICGVACVLGCIYDFGYYIHGQIYLLFYKYHTNNPKNLIDEKMGD